MAKPCLDNWKHLISQWISPGSHNWGRHWVRNASTPSSSLHLHDSYSTFRCPLTCCAMLQTVCQLFFCSDSASLHLKHTVCTEKRLIRSLQCKQQAPRKQAGVLFWAPPLTHPGASVMLGVHQSPWSIYEMNEVSLIYLFALMTCLASRTYLNLPGGQVLSSPV